jgi:hypothetical protein
MWVTSHMIVLRQMSVASQRLADVQYVGIFVDVDIEVPQSQSYVTTHGQSVSMSWCQFTLGPVTRCYILSECCCVVCVGRPLWREVASVSCQSLSSLFSPLSDIRYNLHCTCYMFYVYAIYSGPQSAQAQYSRSCSSRYNGSLDAWTVVRLAAAKFKPLMFSVSGFALPNMADICIFMIFYNSCLLSA